MKLLIVRFNIIFLGLASLISLIWMFPGYTADGETLPPILSIEEIEFSQQVLDAGQTAILSIRIKNVGDGDAVGLTIQLRQKSGLFSSDLKSLSFSRSTKVPTVPKQGGTRTVEISIRGLSNLPNGKANIEILLNDPHFKQQILGDPLTFETRKFPNPKLVLADFAVKESKSASPNKRIDLNEVIDLIVSVQNTGPAAATNVKIEVENSQTGIIWLEFKNETGPEILASSFSIPAGNYKQLTFRYHVNSNFNDNELRFRIKATEKHGKYGFQKTKTVAINTELKATGKIIKPSTDPEDQQHRKPRIEKVPPVSGTSSSFSLSELLRELFVLVLIVLWFVVCLLITGILGDFVGYGWAFFIGFVLNTAQLLIVSFFLRETGVSGLLLVFMLFLEQCGIVGIAWGGTTLFEKKNKTKIE